MGVKYNFPAFRKTKSFLAGSNWSIISTGSRPLLCAGTVWAVSVPDRIRVLGSEPANPFPM